jgi:hypothetical protein
MTATQKAKKKSRGSRKRKPSKPSKPRCSPASPGKDHDFTCYTDDSLTEMRTLWNERHPDDMISSVDPVDIWTHIRERFSKVCRNERCWIRQKSLQNGLSRDVLSYTFAPTAPIEWKKNPSEWLTSTELSELMAHYERRFPSFEFIGPSPIDFDSRDRDGICVWEELCGFTLKDMLKRKKSKLGVIFNTDPHTEDGEHWISMFVDTSHSKPFIFFFDSNGDLPPKEVSALTERIKDQGAEIGLDLEYQHNHPFEHQHGNNECGMYCLYMIVKLLTREHDYEHFKNNRITDKQMNDLRSIWFDKSHF